MASRHGRPSIVTPNIGSVKLLVPPYSGNGMPSASQMPRFVPSVSMPSVNVCVSLIWSAFSL